jgi:hypothetical protein
MAATRPPSRPASIAFSESDCVGRLAIETAKFLGVGVGAEIPVGEIRRQAVTSGYGDEPTSTEIDDLLAEAGLAGKTTVEVPPQGDLFGDLWAVGVNETLTGPTIDGVEDEPTPVERFDSWLERKADDDETSHSYSRSGANRRLARAADVERWFVENCDSYTTVLLTFCADPQAGETVAEHAGRFYPRSVVRKTRRVLGGLGVGDECAGVRVLAPKPVNEDRVPGSNPPIDSPTMTHAHTFLWFPGKHWSAGGDFQGTVRLHTKNVDGATDDLNPLGEAVKVRCHDSWGVKRSKDGRPDRVSTTSLPREVGQNLPLLKAKFDVRGLPAYAREWCARLRLGTDETLDTRGVPRWRPFGQFREFAEAHRETRRAREAGSGENGE